MDYKKIIGAVVTAGLLGVATQILFAQTAGTISPATTSPTTLSIPTDTTPPILSNIRAGNIIGSGAQIMWTTDDLSDSRVTYVPSNAPMFSVGARCDNGGNVLLHCVNITGLLPGYNYYFKAGSLNLAGLLTESPGYFVMPMLISTSTTPTTTPANTATATTSTTPTTTSISTTATTSSSTTTAVTIPSPVISNLRTENIIGLTAQIKWTTDQLSDSGVYYNMSTSASALYSNNRCDGGGYVLQHCVNLANLYQGGTYNYKAESHNTAGLIVSAYGKFLTLLQSTALASTTPAPASTLVTNTAVASTTPAPITGTTYIVPATTTPIALPPIVVPPPHPLPLPVKPVPVLIAPALPVPAPVIPIAPGIAVSSVAVPVKSIVTLKKGGDVLDTAEVHVKVNQDARGVEVRLSRKDNIESFYLGQAQYDPVNTEWVFHWDSTQTPDGSYLLFSVVTTGVEAGVRGLEKAVTINNKKIAEVSHLANGVRAVPRAGTGVSANLGIHATGTVAVSSATSSVAVVPIIDPEKFIEQIKKAKQQEEEQIKKDIANTVTTHFETGAKLASAPVVQAEALKKVEALKTAINEGNVEKKKAIIADIVNSAIPSSGVSQDALAKNIEAGVAKLEQVTIEQKSGVVDTKNFSVDALRVAEVATKADGTQTANKVEFKGKALPNSFATVYIMSIPIVVTVKTDKDGYWNYTLDKELENGKHQVYVAITDVKGAVVAKSSPLPFIKEASAITIDQLESAPAPQESPSFVDNNYFYGSITAIVFILAIILLMLGFKARNTPRL